jgi:hypothetical protein
MQLNSSASTYAALSSQTLACFWINSSREGASGFLYEHLRIILSPIIQSLKASLLGHGVPNDFNDSAGVLKGENANDDTYILI